MELTAGYLTVSWKTQEHVNSPMCFSWIPNSAQNILNKNKKQNWKRRYFVLQEDVSNFPGHSASLKYYKDEKSRTEKGCIDLEHCEEVLSTLDSPLYTHLFALRTLHKRKNEARTYYLAADSAAEMNSWVESLCIVLGLRETQDAEPPPTQPRYCEEPGGLKNKAPVAIPPPIQPVPRGNPNIVPPNGAAKGEDYIPLDNCFSDPTSISDPDAALSSVPHGIAPPLPGHDQVEYDHPKSSKHDTDRNDNVYRTPRGLPITPQSAHSTLSMASQASHDSVYKVPPTRRGGEADYINQGDTSEDDTIYNVPNPAHHSVYNTPKPSLKREPSERDSNSSNGSKHSQLCTDDSGLGSSSDNITQGMRNLKTSHQHSDSIPELYNVPPPARNVPFGATSGSEHRRLLETVPPPARGPDTRPQQETNRAQYVNLNEPPKPPRPDPNQYDFPPPSTRSTKHGPHGGPHPEMLTMQPPAPMPHATVTAHSYVNASTGVVNVCSPMRVPVSPPQANYSAPSSASNTLTRNVTVPYPSGYIPMSKAAAGGDSYLPMAQRSSPPGMYLPMQGHSGDTYTPMDSEDSYLAMQGNGSPQDSYLPMTRTEQGRRMHSRGSRGSGSHSPDTYLPMDNDRASTDSTYQILPPGIHPVNHDYDNRFAQLQQAEYSTGPSNRAVSQAERDSIYSCHPTNKPVMEPPKPLGRGLDAYVPSAGVPSPSMRRMHNQLNAYPSPPPSMRESDMIYDVQPTNRPVPTPRADGAPPIANRPSFNAERSRSFKRNIDTPVLPTVRKDTMTDSSSDDDSDDPSSGSSNDRSMDSLHKRGAKPPYPHPQTEALKRSLNSTPPTPKRPGEIQYLDLGLDEPSAASKKERSPVFSRPTAPGGNTTPTEYHDIDFVKTQALIATKKDVESKRKSSEKSMDE